MSHATGREEEWLQQRLKRHRNPTGTFEVQRPGGIWLQISEQRLEDDGILIVGTDITELKRTQEKLRDVGTELERQVAIRTRELTDEIAVRKNTETKLRTAMLQAEQANQAKSEFLSTMSHELRTPLTSSLGGLILLKNLMSDEFTDEGRNLVDMVLRNNETLLRLVNELLDYDKFLSGTLIIETRSNDITELTSAAVKNLQGYAQTQAVNILWDGNAPPLYAQVQEHRFEQVLNNLLSNAVKFSDPGADVEIFIKKEMGLVIVSVKDKGPGIPESFKAQIFKQFTQADSSSTRKYGGTGLGLAISKVLTESMGGTINFDTEIGVGSTFHVSFPAC